METKKNKAKYVCELCDFSTSYKQNYNKHLSTAKHRKVLFGNKKVLGEFYCDVCDYTAVTKQNFEKHLATVLHLETKKYSHLICTFCNKKYQTRAGLWKHKKSCKEIFQSENNSEQQEKNGKKGEKTQQNKRYKTRGGRDNLGKKKLSYGTSDVDLFKNIEKENDELRTMIKTLCNQNTSLMTRM